MSESLIFQFVAIFNTAIHLADLNSKTRDLPCVMDIVLGFLYMQPLVSHG